MIVRKLERCHVCGAANPWRKYASRVVRGEKRIYVVCKVCGAHETVVFRESVPKQGTNFEK